MGVFDDLPEAKRRKPSATANRGTFDDLPNAPKKAERPSANNSDFARMITGEPKPMGVGGAIKRELGLGGRAAIRGVYDLTTLLGGDLLNAAESKLRGAPVRSQRENADYIADRLGLPYPETSTERIGGDVTGALVGGGGLLGLGRGLATRAPGVAQSVGELLASQPATQIVGNVTGSSAAGITREAGGSPWMQVGAGLLGGVLPGLGMYSSAAGLRGLARGGETGRAQTARTLADFKAAGTTPTVGQATGNRAIRATEVALSRLPGGAGTIARKAQTQGEEIGAGVRSLADDLAPGADATTAGQAIKRGIVGDGGYQQRIQDVANRLYGRLDDQIDPSARVGVGNTKAALDGLNPDIAGAPSLGAMFKNGRIEGIKHAFDNDVNGTAALIDRPGMVDWANGMREALAQEADAIVQQNAQRRSMMLPPLPVPSAADIENRVSGMMEAMVDGRLPYEALKKLRTQTGKQVANANFASDVPVADWKQLYGGLSRDMGDAATEYGASQAFNRANKHYNAAQKRSESIAHVVNRDTPEQIFAAAMNGSDKGATTLNALMKSLPDQGRREVAAAVLDRMGRATKGKQNADGTAFSTETFLTNWNGLSDRARAVLFDRFGPEFRSRVEAITRVAGNLRDGAKVFANPSGTAAGNAQNITYGALAAAAVPAIGGNLLPLAAVGGGIGANSLLARVLTRPESVDWLARRTQTPYGLLGPTAVQSQSGQ